MKKISYELLRGITHLPSGTILSKSGTTDDAATIAEIEAMASVKDGSGNPQYILIHKDSREGAVNSGVIKGAGTPEDPEPPEFDFKTPEGVNLNDVRHTLSSLADGELTFESASALSDDEIKAKTKGIGEGRMKLIRAVGVANDYPTYKAAE